MNKEEINNSLIDTIKSPDFEGLTTNLSEVALDQLAQLDGVVKGIPIIGSIIKIAKIGFTIKDIIFLKKLSNFLWHLREVSFDERTTLIRNLERDSKYKTDVGNKIILLLERADDFEKPKFLANAFKAYLYGKISYSQLQKINFAIDHLYIGDIEEFKLFYQDSQHMMDESTHQNLCLCGFVVLIQHLGGGTNPKINDFGILFAQNVLECQ